MLEEFLPSPDVASIREGSTESPPSSDLYQVESEAFRRNHTKSGGYEYSKTRICFKYYLKNTSCGDFGIGIRSYDKGNKN